MSVSNAQRLAALEVIRLANGGILNPQAVVDTAEDPTHVLHGDFTWDDTEAARKYRLVQAEQCIRLVVTMLPNRSTAIRAYVSLPEDRGIGYRATAEVLGDEERTRKMLEQARKEALSFVRKYRELRTVVTGADEVLSALEGFATTPAQVEAPVPA